MGVPTYFWTAYTPYGSKGFLQSIFFCPQSSQAAKSNHKNNKFGVN